MLSLKKETAQGQRWDSFKNHESTEGNLFKIKLFILNGYKYRGRYKGQ